MSAYARGSATPMKMGGGDGDQAAAKPGLSSEGNPYQKPKTQRIWSTIFLKMGGLSPALSKMGGRVPPSPPVAEPLAYAMHGLTWRIKRCMIPTQAPSCISIPSSALFGLHLVSYYPHMVA